MNRFSEKHLLLMTIGAFLVVVLGIGGLIYMDFQKIYAAEVTDDNPAAADITDPEAWGERRKIQELKKSIAAAQAEAAKIPKREQQVIVYREIVNRDAAILPDIEEVNQLALTINDFQRQAGVELSRVSNLDLSSGGKAIAKIPFKLEIAGSYDELLKFINLFETHPRLVNTRAFSVSAGQIKGTGRDRKAIHRASIDLETYMYTSSAGLAKPVNIANYEKRVGDPVIQKMIRQQKAAFVEKYQLKPRISRRDPLVDSRRRQDEVDEDVPETNRVEQQQLVQQLKFAVEMLKDDVRQEARYAEERKYVQLMQIRPLIDQKVAQLETDIRTAEPKITIPELKQVFHDEVIEPFQTIKAGRDVPDVVRLIGRADIVGFYDRMKSQIDGNEYEKLLVTHKDFKSFVGDKEVADDAAPLVAEMLELRDEAQVMLDFEELKLSYTGLIIREGGSRVLIGTRSFKKDDYVDPQQRCRIVSITRDVVTYELDGYEIHHEVDRN